MVKAPKNLDELSNAIKMCTEKYQKSENNEIIIWRSIDEFLEDMCRRFPNHEYFNHVLIKITAIDRLYAAWLNRKKINYRKVALKLIDSDIDCQLENVGKSLTIKNVKKVANAVATVAGFGNPKYPRFWVFASKYLHFHNRNLFPILDSFAEEELDNIFKKLRLKHESRVGTNRYEKFCRKLLALHAMLSEEGYVPTLSDFDKYLYGKRYLKS